MNNGYYSVKRKPSSTYMFIIFLIIFGILLINSAYKIFSGASDMPFIFIPIWSIMFLITVFYFLNQTSEIIVYNSGKAVFCNLLGKRKQIELSEIKEIKYTNSTIYLKTSMQKFHFFGDFNNFYRFVSDVKKYNNSVVTKGC